MMKKTLSLVLVLAMLAALLVGCGAEAPAPAENAGETAAAAPQEEEKTGENTVLSILSWYNAETLSALKAGFEEANPDITLDIQFAPPVQQYVEKFMLNLGTDQNTDMIFLAPTHFNEAMEANLLLDLSDLDIWEHKNEKIPNLFERDGKKYGFEIDAWIGGIFYNKDILKNVGYETTPATWAEFKDVLQKVKDTGISPYADQKLSTNSIPFGIYISDAIKNDPTIDARINAGETTFEAEYTEALTVWKEELLNTGLYDPISLSLSGEQVVDMFATEQLAMFAGGPWDIASIRSKNPELNFGMMPYIGTSDNVMCQGATNVALAVNAQSEHKEAAVKLLEYLATPKGMEEYRGATDMMLLVDGYEYEVDPVMQPYVEFAVNGDFYLPNNMWDNSAALYDIFLTGCQEIISGVKEPVDITREMDAKMAELNAAK